MNKFVMMLLLVFSVVMNGQETKKILFIGNSLTYFNDMPQTFEAIANSKLDATEVTMYAPGGRSFAAHVNDENVYDKFREEIWDFIVLQPSASESYGVSVPIAQTLNHAKRLQDSIVKYSPCAKILYYEVSNGVVGSSAANLQEYNDSMDIVRSNFEYFADGTELFFAPVGESFRTKWNDDQTDLLWVDIGDLHPNAKGSYIAACVFYATIFQKNSQGSNVYSSLSAQEAADIQILADVTVLNNSSDWRINAYSHYTNFNFTVNNNQVAFDNISQNIDSVEWDFGDGTTSTEMHPNHLYTQIGDFDVRLTTHKSVCSEVVTKTISITILDIHNYELDKKWNFYPNPFINAIRIEGVNNIEKIEIYDITGRKLLFNDELMAKNRTQSTIINLSRLASGIYLLKVNDMARKIVKE